MWPDWPEYRAKCEKYNRFKAMVLGDDEDINDLQPGCDSVFLPVQYHLPEVALRPTDHDDDNDEALVSMASLLSYPEEEELA